MHSILGIDVAKVSLDVVLLVTDQRPVHAQFDNTTNGFKQLKRWLDYRSVQTLHACMEATGISVMALQPSCLQRVIPSVW
jgi:transposase